MLFNSWIFIFLFLPIVWGGFRLLSNAHFTRIAISWLLFASALFYAYWNPPYIFLLLFLIIFNFFIAKQIISLAAYAKWLLVLGVMGDLLPLMYFKYWNFIASTISGNYSVESVFLPLGISFFTFQQITYLADVYNKKSIPEANLAFYALYILFFPHLIAGPIVHHSILIPQLRSLKLFALNWKHLSQGIFLFSMGLFKKVVIADSLSPWVKVSFANQSEYTFMLSWIGALAYTLQLYFDFSGYSDMAMGLAMLFNLNFPVNFNSPYCATSIVNFWKRWHITLSFFLRDYLYIFLGGNRKGKRRKYFNILVTMLLGGFWHGAGWTFILWGLMHGVLICINHIWREFAQKNHFSIPIFFSWLLTFLSVVICWVVFRAESIEQASAMLLAMINPVFSWMEITQYASQVVVIFGLIIYCVVIPENWKMVYSFGDKKVVACKMLASLAALIGSALLIGTAPSEFLYFQF